MYVRLTKAGLAIIDTHPDNALPSLLRSDAQISLADFLHYWYSPLEGIDEGTTLGDFLALFRAVHDPENVLASMMHCDLPAFLAEAALPPLVDDEPLYYLRVYNWASAQDIERLGRRGPFRELPPYSILRGFDGIGPWVEPPEGDNAKQSDYPDHTAYAIEYTSLRKLVAYELRYEPNLVFGGDIFGKPDQFATEITITFGEFAHAILWEIGWHGSPGIREDKNALIEERFVEATEQDENRTFLSLDELLDLLDSDDSDDKDAPGQV